VDVPVDDVDVVAVVVVVGVVVVVVVVNVVGVVAIGGRRCTKGECRGDAAALAGNDDVSK
jgi:hypothetical protein